MPTRIDFRECVHHGIAGPTAEHILASIRAEYCLPPIPAAAAARDEPPAAIRPEDFAAVERALGAAAFRQLLSDLQRQSDGQDARAHLPEFLAGHRYGRATPALVDLARLERALAQSERAPDQRSIGACCLPPSILRGHPDLTLTFHPAWHWLDLGTPADQWRDALLGQDAAGAPPLPRATRLRVHPERGCIVARRLEMAEFAFERAMRDGGSLRQAGEAAHALSRTFDPMPPLHALLMAGAVIDAELHPANAAAHEPHPATSHDR